MPLNHARTTTVPVSSTLIVAVIIALSAVVSGEDGRPYGGGMDLLIRPKTDPFRLVAESPENDIMAMEPGRFFTASNGGAHTYMSQEERSGFGASGRRTALHWETAPPKSYFIPALEIVGFNLALNGAARLVSGDLEEDGKNVYDVTLSTVRKNLIHGPWDYDQDAFHVNQFLHPYQGSIYHGIARSTGLGFFKSLGYTFAGSLIWEIGGETTHPSVNDQVASGIAGSFLGEPLFRMAGLLLEGGGSGPGFWRELGAALLSPPLGFNRLVFGQRFKAVFPSRDPAVFHRARVGAGAIVRVSDEKALEPRGRYQATLDYAMSYGLPGKPDYDYTRPFDYFHIQFNAVSRSKNTFENIMTRGLLLGRKMERGDSFRGVWGLYGSYDFISPHVFRVSSTAASLGTTAQWWIMPAVALQGTVLIGIGYGAGGKTLGPGERDYHYGATGQGLLALRLIIADIAVLDMTARDYYISGLGATDRHGREDIARIDTGMIVRIYGRHAIGIQYVASRRASRYPHQPRTHQTLGTFNLVYTMLSDTRFGAVEWRNGKPR